MAIETRKTNIGGHTVSVTQLPARRAISLKIKLIKVFGPGLAEVLGSIDKPKGASTTILDSDIKGSSLSAGFQKLVDAVDPDVFLGLLEELFQGVRIDNVEWSWELADQNYAGDLGTLYEIAFFVLKVNYESFFAKTRIGTLLSRTTATDQSTPESDG